MTTDRGGKGCGDRSSSPGRETSVFSCTDGKIPLCLADIPHFTVRTIKLIDYIGNKEGRERFFVFEHGTDGFRVGKDEAKNCVWVAFFYKFMKGFSEREAKESVVRQNDVVNSRFVLI